jgi:hypothetical protein
MSSTGGERANKAWRTIHKSGRMIHVGSRRSSEKLPESDMPILFMCFDPPDSTCGTQGSFRCSAFQAFVCPRLDFPV